jgi:transposase-like protein
VQPDIQAEFAHLHHLAAQHTERGYPVEFRQRAVVLGDHLSERGWTQQRIVEALGISRPTLRRWRQEHKADDEASVVEPTLRPVEVVLPAASPRAVSVTSPGGWRVEGLRLDQVVELLGRVS